MSCWEPPCTRTVPKSTFTRRFLAAESVPELSCVQLPPSREMRPCCAAEATDKSAISVPANLENCFNLHLVFLLTPGRSPYQHLELLRSRPVWTGRRPVSTPGVGDPSPHTRFLIHLTQLRQHSAGLRPDVLILVVLCQILQHYPHAAIGTHRPERLQCLGSYASVAVVHERLQHGVAYMEIIFHIW